MNAKQIIDSLIRAIDADIGIEPNVKTRKIALINNLVEIACKYIDIVVRQGCLMQIYGNTTDRDTLQDLADLDKNRSRIHDSLISQIGIVNRLCDEYGLDPVYQGGEHRREKGDFALKLASDYFRDRL